MEYEVNATGRIYNIKEIGNTGIYSFSFCKVRKDKKSDDWIKGYINCVAKEETIALVQEKDKVKICGNFSPNEWEDKDKKKHYEIKIWVSECVKIQVEEESKKQSSEDLMNGFESIPESSDDELPFI